MVTLLIFSSMFEGAKHRSRFREEPRLSVVPLCSFIQGSNFLCWCTQLVPRYSRCRPGPAGGNGQMMCTPATRLFFYRRPRFQHGVQFKHVTIGQLNEQRVPPDVGIDLRSGYYLCFSTGPPFICFLHVARVCWAW